MDIGALIPDERSKLMRSGSCFRCQKQGHMARDCPGPDSKGNQTNMLKKWITKDLDVHIKGLEAKEKKELVAMLVGSQDF